MVTRTMIYILWLLFLVRWIISSNGQAAELAFYDATSCREDGNTQGTRYTCNSSVTNNISSCETFLIFRANHRFPTISAISALFGSPVDTLLQLNNIDSALETLLADREVFVPVSCYCSGGDNFFEARVNYTIIDNTTTFSDTACGVFEGLVKKITLLEENQLSIDQKVKEEDIIKVGFVLNVPLKCACPPANNNNNNNEYYYKYLVTYPLVSGDSITKVSTKFGISNDHILTLNNLKPDTTVYPETTILVPFYSKPAPPLIEFPDNFQPPTPGFLPTKPIQGNIDDSRSTKLKKVYIVVAIIGFSLVLAILFVTGLYIKELNKCRRDIFVIPSTLRSSFTSFSTPGVGSSPRSRPSPRVVVKSSAASPTSSCLSPDLLVDIKYSLYNFTVEELKRVTKDFSNDCKVSENTYRGSLDDEVVVLIREIEFSDIRHVIDLHSKINHVNILKLVGVCYNNNEQLPSYIVLEHPAHGSLRDCLISSASSSRLMSWHRRTQIAFDVAMGLHYLNYCIIPPHSHTRLGSGNIFVTSKWRAKLAVLSSYPAGGSSSSSSSGGMQEYEKLYDHHVLEKEDILEFGMVLLEILSGKVVVKMDDRKSLRESIGFLGGGEDDSEGVGCFENLRRFMDPCLKEEDYPLAEVLCLGVLAKACVTNDPLHRPSMEDVLKVLARMV